MLLEPLCVMPGVAPRVIELKDFVQELVIDQVIDDTLRRPTKDRRDSHRVRMEIIRRQCPPAPSTELKVRHLKRSHEIGLIHAIERRHKLRVLRVLLAHDVHVLDKDTIETHLRRILPRAKELAEKILHKAHLDIRIDGLPFPAQREPDQVALLLDVGVEWLEAS